MKTRNVITSGTLFFISLFFFACEQSAPVMVSDPRVVKLQKENQELRNKINWIHSENKEEKRAIFEYISFMDSLESALNSLQNEYLVLSMDNPEQVRSKKEQLLHRINALNQRITADKGKIDRLEEELRQRASQGREQFLLEQIENYRKQRIVLGEQINTLRTRVDELVIAIETKNELIGNQTQRLNEQVQVIQKKQTIIDTQKKDLDKRQVLFINKKGFITADMTGPDLIIKRRQNKIKILLPDSPYYDLKKIDNSNTLLEVKSEFWVENKLLPVYIRGEM